MIDANEADFLQTCILLVDPKVMSTVQNSHCVSAGCVFNKLQSIKENVYMHPNYRIISSL